jgi:hypothetical protein
LAGASYFSSPAFSGPWAGERNQIGCTRARECNEF